MVATISEADMAKTASHILITGIEFHSNQNFSDPKIGYQCVVCLGDAVVDEWYCGKKLIKFRTLKARTQRTKAIVKEGEPWAIRSPESWVETVKEWEMCDLTTQPK